LEFSVQAQRSWTSQPSQLMSFVFAKQPNTGYSPFEGRTTPSPYQGSLPTTLLAPHMAPYARSYSAPRARPFMQGVAQRGRAPQQLALVPPFLGARQLQPPHGTAFNKMELGYSSGLTSTYPGSHTLPLMPTKSGVSSSSLSTTCSTQDGQSIASTPRLYSPGSSIASSPVNGTTLTPFSFSPTTNPNPKSGLQESDLMELLSQGEPSLLAGSGTDHVRLVSLGCTCGPKLSFQKLGRGAETLPFDWVRSRMEGLLHFMRADFEGFFDYTTRDANTAGHMVMYRSRHHSFWHDDPRDSGMRERYMRRIKRFQSIDARSSPVLFVRAVNSTSELALVEEFLAELMARFGQNAMLLLILDFQQGAEGPAWVRGLNNLMVYFHPSKDRVPASAPYMKPITAGLLWAARKQVRALPFESLRDLAKVATRTEWGFTAHGNVRSFEEP